MRENGKILTEIEAREGVEKITLLLADDSSSDQQNTEQAVFQAGEATPD